MRVVVVGGGIAGLAALRRLAATLPDAELLLVEAEERLGGKLLTERAGCFVIEGAADSFLSRKERGVGLVEELGLEDELVGRRPEHERTFVRRGGELFPLPTGLTGTIPTNLDALSESDLLSPAGRDRLAAEPEIPVLAGTDDESIAAFVTRRRGREAYDALVEPLRTGIFGGDGEHVSRRATCPGLRTLELEHGSVLRGLLAPTAETQARYPAFVSLRAGMGRLVERLADRIGAARVLLGRRVDALHSRPTGYELGLDGGELVGADAVVLAVPAFAAAPLVAELDGSLASELGSIPYASSAIVTLAYPGEHVASPLAGYGYIVPRTEGSDILACTWTSSKWEGRSPAGDALLRVYVGRHGRPDVTLLDDDALVALARDEVDFLGVVGAPLLTRIHRWPRGMPQYVLGHPERVERIEAAVAAHPGLALAGAAYRGVGIPDCILSGEDAAGAVASALERVPG